VLLAVFKEGNSLVEWVAIKIDKFCLGVVLGQELRTLDETLSGPVVAFSVVL